jgi:hypothetical protein
MCAIVVQRLIEKEWDRSSISEISDAAMESCLKWLGDDEVLAGVAANAAIMHAAGSEQKTIQEMATAVFAIKAVGIADDLNRVRAAKFN